MIQVNFKKLLSKQNINLVLALLPFLLVVYYDWSFELAIALALLIYSLLSDFSPVFYARAAVFFGTISGIALAINHESIAESLGVISFVLLITFLVITINRSRK